MFRNREDAGLQLARELVRFREEHPMVLALPRGGVPVGYQVAKALHVPLDVLIVRKLGAPFQPELGVGAIAEGDATFVDRHMCESFGISQAQIDEIAAQERRVVAQRIQRYRGGEPLPPLAGKTIILVDDGVATGGTARAAILALRKLGPKRIVFAAPVTSAQAADILSDAADELVAVLIPENLIAIGEWYRDFGQVDDSEVVAWLQRAKEDLMNRESEAGRPIELDVGEVVLEGNLSIPRGATGLVLFVHGSGSSRFSPRNRYVAEVLRSVGLGTLLMDLLTAEEETFDARTMALRFDIDLLTKRVLGATRWLRQNAETRHLELGYFGSSTGAAAAIKAAAKIPNDVFAIVSRGGRPDLAGHALGRVRAPTLLLVGGLDEEVLALNQGALEELTCERDLVVVPGATHLFEERGTLEQVAARAAEWFARYLAIRTGEARPSAT